MDWETVLGLVAGVCTTVSVIPQLYKAYQTKKVNDVSPFMFAILMLGVGLWVIYGFIKNDIPIIATNGISLALNTFMLYMMVKYRKSNN